MKQTSDEKLEVDGTLSLTDLVLHTVVPKGITEVTRTCILVELLLVGDPAVDASKLAIHEQAQFFRGETHC